MEHSKSKQHKKIYKTTCNAAVKVNKVQEYGERIEYLIEKKRIENKPSEIKPGEIISDAKKKDSPLHDYFEWDDKKAANKYRYYQANQLVAHIFIVEDNDDDGSHRAFMSVVNEEKENVYVELDEALENPTYVKQLLAECRRYMEGFLRTMKLLEEHL